MPRVHRRRWAGTVAMHEFLQNILSHPLSALAVIANIVLIESLLSVDNAAVLATVVLRLSAEEQTKALRYGLVGAYVFRGIAIVFAALLLKLWWLKPLGGLYLIYLFFRWLSKRKPSGSDEHKAVEARGLYRLVEQRLGPFWATVAVVELVDMAFSIDNVFAVVAFTPNILLICVGILIGMLAMRFAAQIFVGLMRDYPFLEASAYAVIGLLGVKLVCSLYEHFYPEAAISRFLQSKLADVLTSVLTISIFAIPILASFLWRTMRRTR
jgi:YkoY family integral membrane protein